MQAVAEFIAKDLHPITAADGVGFLNLMHLVEPLYAVPCQGTMTAQTDTVNMAVKEQVLRSQGSLSAWIVSRPV